MKFCKLSVSAANPGHEKGTGRSKFFAGGTVFPSLVQPLDSTRMDNWYKKAIAKFVLMQKACCDRDLHTPTGNHRSYGR